jgi:hypothetical protein
LLTRVNVQLLLKSYDSEFLQLTLEFNNEHLQKTKDTSVRSEAEKVKKMVEALQKE